MFEIILNKKSQKFLNKQNEDTHKRITNRLQILSENYPDITGFNIINFKTQKDVIRFKIGQIRLKIKVYEKDKILLVTKIGYRGDVYK